MNLILGKPKGDIANAKPKETLADKVGGFKFAVPGSTKNKSISTGADTPSIEAPVDTQPDKPNAKQLLVGKPVVQSQLTPASLVKKPSSLVPELSDDKYEVVANSQPELSEQAGDKFQQQLGMLQSSIDGTGDLKNQMENILVFLDDNPEYKENVSPKDVSVFVAACRKIAGITVTEKVARKTKTKTTTADVQAVMDDLADLSFDF